MLILEKRVKFLSFFVLSVISLTSLGCKIEADRGMIPVIPNVSVYEPGQKAIIGWDGEKEILILSTDVYSSHKTKVLEILPLPSKPEKIEMGSFESFETVNELIVEHGLEIQEDRKKGLLAPSTEGVTVLFKTKIGVHDITIVEASNPEDLTYWVQDFLKKNGINTVLDLSFAKQVIEEYTSVGFRFFVLDIIEVSDEKSVEPIVYEFRTPFLYYPLRISSIIPGDTKISLFLITKEKLEERLFYESSMQIAYYETERGEVPVQFKVSLGEISKIDLRLADLFDEEAWFTAVFYEGDLSWLSKDLRIALHAKIGEKILGNNLENPVDFLIGVSVGFVLSLIALLTVLFIKRELRKE